MSKNAAARHFGIDRKSVTKMLKHAVPPGYRRQGPSVRPKRDPFIPIIDRILEEDKAPPKKQRHTATRITVTSRRDLRPRGATIKQP